MKLQPDKKIKYVKYSFSCMLMINFVTVESPLITVYKSMTSPKSECNMITPIHKQLFI